MGPTWFNAELDDRRELWKMLDRLPPAKRIAWLQWCCKQANNNQSVGVFVEKDSGTSTAEVFADAMSIMNQGNLTLNRAGEYLVSIVRGKGK